MKRSQLVPVSLLLFLLSVCSAPTWAQQPPAAPPTPNQPPAIRFDAKGMTLLDAVKLTLQHSPNIKLRETDTALQMGVLRSQKGLFDWVLSAGGSFGRDQRQMLDSDIADQQQTRDDLAAAVTEATRMSSSFVSAANTLSNPAIYTNPGSINWTAGIADPSVANNMSVLGSQMVLYNDLLKSPLLTDAKLRADIEDLRKQTLDKNITYYVSQRDRIAAFPGQLSTQLANLGPTPEEQWSKQGSFNFDVAKVFRSGLSMRPYVDLAYDSQNFVGKDSYDTAYGGMGIEPVYSGEIGFEVSLPLLRGAGSKSVAAGEIAAKYDLEASRLAVLHQQSQSVFETVQAYWEVRAAADEVEVLRRSVELQGELANMTRALIAANEKPRSDEARVLASNADSRSRFEAAQRRLTDARVSLAKVMGVAIEDALFLPVAADAFPAPPDTLDPSTQAYSAFIQEAIAHRYDRQAALQSQASGKALVEGARIDTRSLLNLKGKVWGTNAHQTTPKYGEWVFRSASVGVDYQHPFGNNAAKGYLEQRQAGLKQTEINTADLERTIALNVTQYAESLKVAAGRLKLAEEAVRQYDQTIRNEQARFKSGDSSLVDTILTEQQTTNARLALVSAQQDYVSLLAALRYEAGMLVQDNNVTPANLVAVPAALLKR
jgi:outer membrane protein TolC